MSSVFVRIAFACCLLLAGLAAHAQAPASQNAAEAVRAQYQYPRELPGFELVGDAADPSPGFGVAIQWVSPEHLDVRLDVFLYRMHKARLPEVALREAAARYESELELSYRDTPIDSGKFQDLTWSPAPFDRAMEHRFSYEQQDRRAHSHTLLFYDRGHHLKFRASGSDIEPHELQMLTRKLAHGFLARFEVAQPFGHRCSPPDVGADCMGDDVRVSQGGN